MKAENILIIAGVGIGAIALLSPALTLSKTLSDDIALFNVKKDLEIIGQQDKGEVVARALLPPFSPDWAIDVVGNWF